MCSAVNNFGYFNNEIEVQWHKYFDKYTKKKCKKIQRVLIIDGASCYINEKFLKVCYSKNILLF